jgi:hypothetical protein
MYEFGALILSILILPTFDREIFPPGKLKFDNCILEQLFIEIALFAF